MKTNLLFLFTMISFLGFGQLNFSSDSLYQSFNSSLPEADIVIHHSFIPENVPDSVKWEVYSVEVPATWTNDAFVCDATQCYDENTDENAYMITINKSSTLDVHFLNKGEVGVGTVKLLIYEVLDSANTFKIITYVANVQEGVGVKNIKNELDVKLYPNPATEKLNFSTSEVVEKLEIYNVIGKQVLQANIKSDFASVAVNQLEKGVYIIKLYSEKGSVYSQSFVKK